MYRRARGRSTVQPGRARWFRGVVASLAVVVGLVGFVAAPAAADPQGPSPQEVREAKEEARERARDVGRIEAKLVRADSKLQELRAEVEKLIERYHGEQVKLERAREAHRAAKRRLAEATRTVHESRDEIAQLAAEQYRTRGGLGELAAMVTGEGGVAGFLDRMSTVHALSRERESALDRMRAAKIVAGVLRQQAHDAMVEQREATKRVAEAKKEAEAAVSGQLAKIENIKEKKAELADKLAQARNTADRLERAREAALARARARRAAAAADDLSYGGGGAPASKGQIAVQAALRWLGTPYSWGGGTVNGPSYGIAHGSNIYGFDCSGLTMYAWAQAGVNLDHWTGTQWTSGPHVPLDQLRPGDLVFFGQITSDLGDIHHVGIYIGNGRMVEAPYTGAVVRISSIWRSDLVGATRPAG